MAEWKNSTCPSCTFQSESANKVSSQDFITTQLDFHFSPKVSSTHTVGLVRFYELDFNFAFNPVKKPGSDKRS